MQHKEVIVPALMQGKIVLSDRCFWSAVVYGILDRMQGEYDYNLGEVLLVSQGILSFYHQFIAPDKTFYLRISLNTALERLSSTQKEKEIYESKEKLEKIIWGYEWLVKKFRKEFVILDGEKSQSAVAAWIREEVEK
jgi:dTMP kinase